MKKKSFLYSTDKPHTLFVSRFFAQFKQLVFANCLHIKEHIDDIIETKLVVELHLTIHRPEFSVELPFCRNKVALWRASHSLLSILVTSRTPAYNTYTKKTYKTIIFCEALRNTNVMSLTQNICIQQQILWCHQWRYSIVDSKHKTYTKRHAEHAYFNWHWEIIWVIFDIEHLYSTADHMMPSMTLSSSDTVRNDLRVLYILFQVHMYFHKGNCLHKYQCLLNSFTN